MTICLWRVLSTQLAQRAKPSIAALGGGLAKIFILWAKVFVQADQIPRREFLLLLLDQVATSSSVVLSKQG
jgi:hypothetical protein